MTTKPGDNSMLTRQEAAHYLGCSISYLEKKATNEPKLITFVKIGKRVRYRVTDLDCYIAGKLNNH